MTDFPAVVSPDTLVPALLAPGRTTGLLYPKPSTRSLFLDFPTPTGSGPWAAGGAAGGSVTPVNRPAILDRRTSVAVNWFGLMHVLPREVDFGNIITPVTRRFEVFNATDGPSTVASVLNDPLLGITLPDTSFPLVLQQFQSTLDPGTTLPLDPSGARAVAGSVGLASFDSAITFNSATGPLRLGVAGTRTVVILFPWEAFPDEVLEWLTAINETSDSTEQRTSPRSFPRQRFRPLLRMSDNERRRFNLLLEQVHGIPLGLSIWTEQMSLTAAATAGATSITVNSTTDVDIRVGETAIIYQSPQKFDVLEISAKTATTITFTSQLLNSYVVGDSVMPMRVGRLRSTVQGSRYPVVLQDAAIDFEVDDNHTGAPTGDLTGWSSLDGKLFMDDCNFISSAMQESRERRLFVVDNNTGAVTHSTPWARDKRNSTKGWRTKTRAQLMKLRRLLIALRGRQVSFKIPTFAEDLRVTQTLSSGSNTMTVENVFYSRYVVSGRQFRITFTDGTSLTRTITASSELSATEEQLTVNTTWPSTKTAAEVQRVEFIEVARLETDAVTIQHGDYVGKAAVEVPIRQVKS